MVSRQPEQLTARWSSAGLSLVELLVAMLVTLIGLLVITQVFVAYEGWKRTTTGVAQTQESGLLGAFAIEQDLRNAGFGIVGTGCPAIEAYNRKATPSKVPLSASGAGVSITPSGDDKNVRIDVVYSSSPFANAGARVQQQVTSDSDPLYVDNAIGIDEGSLILISDGASCTVRQVSTKRTEPVHANVTSAGNSTLLDMASSLPWNPATGDESFPGYVLGSRVLNLGKVVRHSYYLQGQTLRMDEYDPDDGSLTSYDLVSGVVGLRAVCLPLAKEKEPPCSSQTTAVRFSLAVQSAVREKIEKSETGENEVTREIVYWPDSPDLPVESQELKGEQQYYRYRVFNTIVPFKNVIWNQQ